MCYIRYIRMVRRWHMNKVHKRLCRVCKVRQNFTQIKIEMEAGSGGKKRGGKVLEIKMIMLLWR